MTLHDRIRSVWCSSRSDLQPWDSWKPVLTLWTNLGVMLELSKDVLFLTCCWKKSGKPCHFPQHRGTDIFASYGAINCVRNDFIETMAGEDQCHPTQVGQDWARGLFFFNGKHMSTHVNTMVNTVFSMYFWCDFQGDIRKNHGNKSMTSRPKRLITSWMSCMAAGPEGRNDPDGANNAFGVWATEVMMRVII